MRLQKKPRRGWLLSTASVLTLLVASAGLRAQNVVINEIMYHPSSQNPREEYIELFNRAATNVNLSGWQLKGGVSFTFPTNTFIRANDYLVASAHRQSFQAKYPGVTNVIGDWIIVRTTNLLGSTLTNFENI